MRGYRDKIFHISKKITKFVALMKYVFALFIFIVLSCSKSKNTEQKDYWDNNILMQEYPWNLDMDKLSSEAADSIFQLMEIEYGFDFSKIIIEEPTIRINYTYGQYNEIIKKKSFILNAENGRNFSAREILFKINNETYQDMKGDPHYFFEGMVFHGLEDGIPTYQIAQGS